MNHIYTCFPFEFCVWHFVFVCILKVYVFVLTFVENTFLRITSLQERTLYRHKYPRKKEIINFINSWCKSSSLPFSSCFSCHHHLFFLRQTKRWEPVLVAHPCVQEQKEMLHYFKTYCLNNLHLVVHDVCIFNCKMTALLFHVINRFVLLYICPAIDHCWHQNVWRTKTWHKVQSSVPWMCLPHFEVGTHQSVCIIQFIMDPCVFYFPAAEFQNILNWG